MLDDLRTLVEIESPSSDLAALQASAAAVAGVLEKRLGGTAVLVESPAGPHVRWSGGGSPKVLVLGHHDTVFPHGTLAERPFTVADGRVYGPGVFDMLGGLVQAIHGLALLERRAGVEVLITCDEEVGSNASRELIQELALECGAVLVFEGAGEGGAVKTGRKGCGTFEVAITGRASHAGLEPEAGVNALVEAAHQVLAIAALARPELGTTVVPSMASAGTASNVVPAQASLTVDVRVASVAEKERLEAGFGALEPRHPEAVLKVSGGITRPPMPEDVSAQLFEVARQFDGNLRGVSVGGGSDGNLTAAVGVPTLDGLGAVGGGAHADHEYLVLDSMSERARLTAHLVRHLTAG
ncbi:M20 family metallopeptidase [Kineosporia babensis]